MNTNIPNSYKNLDTQKTNLTNGIETALQGYNEQATNILSLGHLESDEAVIYSYEVAEYSKNIRNKIEEGLKLDEQTAQKNEMQLAEIFNKMGAEIDTEELKKIQTTETDFFMKAA